MKKKNLLLTVMVMHLTFFGQAQWQLTGNSISAGNFLGTTNAQPLVFKVNGSLAGLIDYNSANACTAFGYQTLASNSGIKNTAMGYQALNVNTTGQNNTAFGYQGLVANTTGNHNTAIGYWNLPANTSGTGNTAVGLGGLFSNTTGNWNINIGFAGLTSNTTGNNNTAIGFEPLFNTTTGYSNIAIGPFALYKNVTGANLTAIGDSALYNQNGGAGGNTAVGSKSLFNNTTASTNTALGYNALFSITTGGNNTAVGYNALKSCNSAGVADRVENTAVGESALTATTSGGGNTGVGTSALISNTTGAFNIAIGDATLVTNTTGNSNIFIGGGADVPVGNLNNASAIGFGAISNASNKMWLGNSFLASLTCVVALTVTSDGRFKKNIQENVPGLEFINQLRPVTYTLDLTGMNKFIRPNPSQVKSARSGTASAIESEAIDQGEKVIHTGFLAQDVEAAAKKLNYTFSGVDAPKNSNDVYGLRYSEFVMPLVKAVQQLSHKNDSLQQVVNSLQSQIDDIRTQLSSLKTGNTYQAAGNAAVLNQNAPNPFNDNTLIGYYLPPTTGNAQILITDLSGRSIKTIALNKGAGQVSIPGGSLASGTYIYTLIADGKIVDSKKMILTK